MKISDPRLRLIRQRIAEKRIITFRQIFKYLHKPKVARSLGIDIKFLRRVIENPEKLSVKILARLLELIGIDLGAMLKLMRNQFNAGKVKPYLRFSDF